MGFFKRLFGGHAGPSLDHPLLDSAGSVVMFLFSETLDMSGTDESSAIIGRIQADRDAIASRTGAMLGVTLHVCYGFLKLSLDERPPAARVLAEWVQEGTFGADATGLAPAFREKLKPERLQDDNMAAQSFGLNMYLVCVGPISDRYVRELRAELQKRFRSFLGVINFRGTSSVTKLAQSLYVGEFEMQL